VTFSDEMKQQNSADPLLDVTPAVDRTPLDAETFRRMIAIERKRTERSMSPFLLILLECVGAQSVKKHKATLNSATSALLLSSRDTDLVGWYKNEEIVGAMFTGLVVNDKREVLDTFLTKVTKTLRNELSEEQFNQIRISFHLFPDDWDHETPGRPSNAALYPDLTSHDEGRRSVLIVKRTVDLIGSATALILCSPLFLFIALAVKLTSKGPVFYRQQRSDATVRRLHSSNSDPCL